MDDINEEDDLTVAYMLGLHHGRKEGRADSSGSTATCVLEAKDGHVWKTIDQQVVPLKHLESTLEWLEIFGNRQFSRHAKRRVRRIK